MEAKGEFDLLHICNNDFCSFFREPLANCFSEARATACDDRYLALKAGAEDFLFSGHFADAVCVGEYEVKWSFQVETTEKEEGTTGLSGKGRGSGDILSVSDDEMG
jgi:hypothetical protein